MIVRCDGRLPTCGPCATARTPCLPSERLVVRADCECDRLRLQVQRLEARVKELTERIEYCDAHCESRNGLDDQETRDVDASSYKDAYCGLPLLGIFATSNPFGAALGIYGVKVMEEKSCLPALLTFYYCLSQTMAMLWWTTSLSIAGPSFPYFTGRPFRKNTTTL